MSTQTSLPRRTFLKGTGALMSLPLLDAMLPQTARAERIAGKPPVRMAFIFFPNGCIQPAWKPKETGRNYTLTPTLQPLAKLKDHFNVITGLDQANGWPKGDGAGDHARSAAVFLTGAHPYKTSGAHIRAGVSVDQAAAARIGYQTLLPSLELGIERGRNAGNCDSGYSCAYSSNIAWKSPTTPMAKEINPRLAFERLFGRPGDKTDRAKRNLFRRSILDIVAADARKLQQRLGRTDRRKIDEYFTSVRELERRIERVEQAATKRPPKFPLPSGIPREFQEHLRLMYDLMVLAFRTDSTRVATFMVGNAGSNRAYPMVGVNQGWHSLSHHRNKEDKIKQLQKIDKYHIEQFAYFLDKLKSVREGAGTLLDHSMIAYGSGLGDGNRHTHANLPMLLAGHGGGTIRTGRHIRLKPDAPMNNLFLSLLDRVGAGIKKIGDSSGRLKELDG